MRSEVSDFVNDEPKGIDAGGVEVFCSVGSYCNVVTNIIGLFGRARILRRFVKVSG